MRPVLVFLLATVILGSVGLYTAFVHSITRQTAATPQLQMAAGQFQLELTTTFDAQCNSFTVAPTSVLVTFEGRVIFQTRQTVPAGRRLVVPINGLKVGTNELYVEANVPDAKASSSVDAFDDGGSPAADGADRIDSVLLPSRAVRVRLLRDAVPIADHTLWSEPGQSVRGVVVVEVPPQGETGQGAH